MRNVRRGRVPGCSMTEALDADAQGEARQTSSKTQRFGATYVTSESSSPLAKVELIHYGIPGSVTSYGTVIRPPRSHSALPAGVPSSPPATKNATVRRVSHRPPAPRLKESARGWNGPERGGGTGKSQSESEPHTLVFSDPTYRSKGEGSGIRPLMTTSLRQKHHIIGGGMVTEIQRREVFTPAPPLPPSAVGHPGEPETLDPPPWMLLGTDSNVAQTQKSGPTENGMTTSERKLLKGGQGGRDGAGEAGSKVQIETHGRFRLLRKKSTSSW